MSMKKLLWVAGAAGLGYFLLKSRSAAAAPAPAPATVPILGTVLPATTTMGDADNPTFVIYDVIDDDTDYDSGTWGWSAPWGGGGRGGRRRGGGGHHGGGGHGGHGHGGHH